MVWDVGTTMRETTKEKVLDLLAGSVTFAWQTKRQ